MSVALSLVVDRADSLAHARHLHALNGHAGRMVLSPTIGRRSLHWLARDIQVALGKDIELFGEVRDKYVTWYRACLWAAGHSVTDVIVNRGHVLAPSKWLPCVELALLARANLWLVVQETISPSLEDFTRAWGFRTVAWSDFAAKHRVPRQPKRRPAPARPYPTVPLSDAPRFLADCQQLIEPADLPLVEHDWSLGAAAALAWRPSSDAETLGAFVQQLLEGCASLDQALARLRGAQFSLFRDGWYLTLSVEALSALWSSGPTSEMEDDLAAIAAVPNPRLAALATLARVTGLGPDALTAVPISDVVPDGSAITVDDRRHVVPPPGRPVLRTQCLARAYQGATDEAPFIEGDDDSRGPGAEAGITRRSARIALGRLSVALGIGLASHHDVAADRVAHSWLIRRHIVLRSLS